MLDENDPLAEYLRRTPMLAERTPTSPPPLPPLNPINSISGCDKRVPYHSADDDEKVKRHLNDFFYGYEQRFAQQSTTVSDKSFF